jgi:hypothetical protein
VVFSGRSPESLSKQERASFNHQQHRQQHLPLHYLSRHRSHKRNSKKSTVHDIFICISQSLPLLPAKTLANLPASHFVRGVSAPALHAKVTRSKNGRISVSGQLSRRALLQQLGCPVESASLALKRLFQRIDSWNIIHNDRSIRNRGEGSARCGRLGCRISQSSHCDWSWHQY